MGSREHWEDVYSGKPPDRLGWYKPRIQTSIRWIRALELPRDAPVIDIGGGASTLVDDLLDGGHTDVTVLDISETALSVIRGRLGRRQAAVSWMAGDITELELPAAHYALWHDRAVFHFLVDDAEREGYRRKLLGSLRPAGYLIIATFAPEAPPRCSGLPVRRYDHEQLAETFGERFRLIRHQKEMHITPDGVEQMYLYCLFRLNAAPATTGLLS